MKSNRSILRKQKKPLSAKEREHLAVKEALHHFSETVKEGQEGEGFITDDIIVERGNPVEEILKHAGERSCDLIVMGTHGHGTLEDVMIGSTAQTNRAKIEGAGVSNPATRRIKLVSRALIWIIGPGLRCTRFIHQSYCIKRAPPAIEILTLRVRFFGIHGTPNPEPKPKPH